MREHYRGRSVVGVIAALLATSLFLTCTTDPVEATGRECPRDLWGLLKEVYRSLDANNKQLPIGGAKTIIDMLMVDKVGDVGTFEEKLRKLEALGFISATNREVLAAALDVGHAAAHRGHIPEEHEVSAERLTETRWDSLNWPKRCLLSRPYSSSPWCKFGFVNRKS